jgi:hypothetical protein
MILKLLKALYGTKQGATLWQQMVHKFLLSISFNQSKYDNCIFWKNTKDAVTYIIVYVDDFLIMGDTNDELETLIRKEYKDITVKKGKTLHYLGMTIEIGNESATFSMNAYVDKLLEINKVQKEYSTPARNDIIKNVESKPLSIKEKKWFHTTVACLIWIAMRIRGDLLFTTSVLSRKVQNPTIMDKQHLLRALGYLKRTRHIPLKLEIGKGNISTSTDTTGSTNDVKLEVFVDAAYAIHDDYKSQTGSTMRAGKGCFNSRSKKQTITAKSSTGAETIAVSDIASPTIGISNFSRDLGTRIVPTIYEDNMSTIKMIHNGKPNADHSRHINIRQFFISDIIKRGEIKLQYVKTEDQIADILTKPLQGLQFMKLRNLLLNYNPTIATLRGRANYPVAVESKETLSLITVTN